jgi:hypothetical protein
MAADARKARRTELYGSRPGSGAGEVGEGRSVGVHRDNHGPNGSYSHFASNRAILPTRAGCQQAPVDLGIHIGVVAEFAQAALHQLGGHDWPAAAAMTVSRETVTSPLPTRRPRPARLAALPSLAAAPAWPMTPRATPGQPPFHVKRLLRRLRRVPA